MIKCHQMLLQCLDLYHSIGFGVTCIAHSFIYWVLGSVNPRPGVSNIRPGGPKSARQSVPSGQWHEFKKCINCNFFIKATAISNLSSGGCFSKSSGHNRTLRSKPKAQMTTEMKLLHA